MSHLVVTIDEKLLGEFPIEKEKVSIGRKPDNDICLNNLAISGYHSQIITVLDSSFLEDLNSTNGTYVNARLVKKHALEDGDLIDIGNHRIRYVNGSGEQKKDDNSDVLEKTIVLAPNDTDLMRAKAPLKEETKAPELTPELKSELKPETKPETKPEIKKEQTIVEPKQKTQTVEARTESSAVKETPTSSAPATSDGLPLEEKAGKLQVLNGKNAGLVLDLKKSLTTFGSPKLAVAGVTKRAKGYFLIHVQGKEGNPTLLNGEPMQEKAARLEDHDIIEVSGVKLEFFTE